MLAGLGLVCLQEPCWIIAVLGAHLSSEKLIAIRTSFYPSQSARGAVWDKERPDASFSHLAPLWLNVCNGQWAGCNGVWIMHSVIIRCSNTRLKHLLAASLVTEQWFMSDWGGCWGRCALGECSNEIIHQLNICTRAISLACRTSSYQF